MRSLGKMHRSHRKGVLVTCLSLIIITGLLIAGFWFYKQTEVVKAQQAADAVAKVADARIAQIEAKKKEPVYLSLPGADKFQVPVENYEDPTNVWTLVNKERALPTDYIPPQLVIPNLPIRPNATSDEKHIRQTIVDPLTQLFDAASKDGHSLMIGSAYRSAVTQTQLFNSYVASAGYEEANMYSAHPGHSEHQTGLAVDISTTSQQCYLDECFIGTTDGQWLADNAYKFGFTLRYPKGKEAITGYNFEPWHYRYVGVKLATALHQSGLTLEEAWPYMEQALATLRANRALPPAAS